MFSKLYPSVFKKIKIPTNEITVSKITMQILKSELIYLTIKSDLYQNCYPGNIVIGQFE